MRTLALGSPRLAGASRTQSASTVRMSPLLRITSYSLQVSELYQSIGTQTSPLLVERGSSSGCADSIVFSTRFSSIAYARTSSPLTWYEYEYCSAVLPGEVLLYKIWKSTSTVLYWYEYRTVVQSGLLLVICCCWMMRSRHQQAEYSTVLSTSTRTSAEPVLVRYARQFRPTTTRTVLYVCTRLL